MNFLTGEIKDSKLIIEGVKFKIPDDKLKLLKEQGYQDKKIILGIRPEHIHHSMEPQSETGVSAFIEVSELNGAETYLYSKVAEQKFMARVDSSSNIKYGDTVQLTFDVSRAHFFDMETEARIK